MEHPELNESDEVSLFFTSDSHDHPITYTFSIARLKKGCPKGPAILESDLGGNIHLDGMDPFGEDESTAFSLILKMLNGDNNIFRYPMSASINPRVLFYMTELYVWLGSPIFTFVREASV